MNSSSRYIVDTIPEGFVVKRRPHPLDTEGTPDWMVDLAYEYSGGRRPPVTVIYRPHYLEVDHGSYGWKMSIVNFPDLANVVAKRLMAGWSPAEKRCEHEGPCDCRPFPDWPHVWAWAIGRTRRAVGGIVYQAWRHLLDEVDATALDVQRKVFSVSYGYEEPSLVLEPEFYRYPFIVGDVRSYRAAAIATWLCSRRYPTERGIEAMHNWRALFSPTGASYRSLNRTLTHLPGNVPPRVLKELRRFVLPRPIFNRLELIATILGHTAVRQRHLKVWSFARQDQIADAMRRVGRSILTPLSPRRWRDVETLVSYLNDYPDQHNGNVVGLAERAIRWHRDRRREIGEENIARLGFDTAVSLPPIPPPTIAGVRFLKTVGDLFEEGEAMNHCVASYASDAVNGSCYLFHVDYDGERATVQIGERGNVVQSRGPRNRDNTAAHWGRTQLGIWGRQVRKALPPPADD